MNLAIVNVSSEVIGKIKGILTENKCDEKELRIVGSLGFGDIPEGFKIMPGEITANDQVQEIEGITFIVANILVKLYKSFNITCSEENGFIDLKIVPNNN
jgi:hypothetical protein